MPSILLNYLSDETQSDYMARTFCTLGTMLACLVYGIHLATLGVALQYMLRPSPCPTRQNIFSLTFVIWLFILATIGVALQIRWNHFVFIEDHAIGDAQFLTSQVGNPLNIANTVMFLVINWFSDSMLIWRFYKIFDSHLIMTILPVTVLSSSIVVSSFFLRDIAAVVVNPWQPTRISTVIIYFSLSVTLNACLTGLIIYRICWKSQFHSSAGRRIAKMFAESAGLFVVTALIFVGLCLKRNFGQNIVLPILGQLQALSPLFIIMRVAQSRFLPSQDGFISDQDLTFKKQVRPSLSLNIDFKSSRSTSTSPATTSPSSVKFSLPSPLPSAKVKKEIVNSSDFLESPNRKSWISSHPPPKYTISEQDAYSFSRTFKTTTDAGSSDLV